MKREYKPLYEVVFSNASQYQKREVDFARDTGIVKESSYSLTSNAQSMHTTRRNDRYDSVKKQSTGHLKDF